MPLLRENTDLFNWFNKGDEIGIVLHDTIDICTCLINTQFLTITDSKLRDAQSIT